MKTYSNNSAEERALEKFSDMMITKIESIQADWKKPWFTSGLSWATNMSGREYNGMNAFMLLMLCEEKAYDVPVFATFDRITALNFTSDKEGKRHKALDEHGESLPYVKVNKGEEAFPVFINVFTCINKDTKERIKYDEYIKLSEEARKNFNVYPSLKSYNVFNVCAQTNIKEARPDLYAKLCGNASAPASGAEDQFTFAPLDDMIAHGKWVCPIREIQSNEAYYCISKDEIVIPLRSAFKDGESFVSNAFHEMAHSTGAECRLNRLKPSTFGSKEYATEELVAEMTAALVCSRYGIVKHIKDDSAAYLKCWLNSLKEDSLFLKSVLTDVRKASYMISTEIDKLQNS